MDGKDKKIGETKMNRERERKEKKILL